ncbi:unnamed protein product, partial [Nesidiocoris tenuis]
LFIEQQFPAAFFAGWTSRGCKFVRRQADTRQLRQWQVSLNDGPLARLAGYLSNRQDQ